MPVPLPQYDIACENCSIVDLCRPIRLGNQEIDLIRGVVTRRKPIHRGESIFNQHEPFRSIFVVCSGATKTIAPHSTPGKERIVGFTLPGELLGADAIGLRHHPTTAVALRDSKVCEIPYHHVEDVGARVPKVQTHLVNMMSSELQNAQRLSAQLLGRHSAEQKLAAFLLNLSNRFQQHGFSPLRFKLSMTRIDIGNYIGLATETVSRVFKRFQHEGLIVSFGSGIQLTNPDKLLAVADGTELPAIRPV